MLNLPDIQSVGNESWGLQAAQTVVVACLGLKFTANQASMLCFKSRRFSLREKRELLIAEKHRNATKIPIGTDIFFAKSSPWPSSSLAG